jgi:preprotein translocase subunit SecY
MADYWSGGNILSFVNLLTGGALGQGTLFALGVSPYITASIVMKLLSIAIPYFEKKSKEGEEGKKVINAWTRGVTVVLAIITSIGYVMMLNSYGMLLKEANVFVYFVMIACYCAGAALVMWLAERINDHGIGNGISIILFANIISGIPGQLAELWTTSFSNPATGGFDVWGLIVSILFLVVLLAMLMLIVWMSDAERRIPIQYAKRVVGRKMYGGQNTNLPIKVNMSGVMPIIFANSIVALLPTIASFIAQKDSKNWFVKFVEDWFSPTTWPYLIVFFVLLIAFAYFYVAISFNPIEVANNIKNNGGAIPGIRSGRPTVDFIKKVLSKITLVGALLVAVIACVPMIAGIILAMDVFVVNNVSRFPISAMAFGGSSMMIVVGVAIETTRELEAQMSLRNYKGFLD